MSKFYNCYQYVQCVDFSENDMTRTHYRSVYCCTDWTRLSVCLSRAYANPTMEECNL